MYFFTIVNSNMIEKALALLFAGMDLAGQQV